MHLEEAALGRLDEFCARTGRGECGLTLSDRLLMVCDSSPSRHMPDSSQCCDVAKGLRFVHDRGIVHANLTSRLTAL
jgi:hypothetical protein